VGVVGIAACRIGDGDGFEGFDDGLANLTAGETGLVGADGFGDLFANGHDRVEGGHGLLKNHGDVAAAFLAHGFVGQGEKVDAVEANGSFNAGVGVEETEDSKRGNGFAGAGFADEAEDFAGRDGETEVGDDLGAEVDGEIGDF